MSETQTTIAASNYTPLDSRSEDLGKAIEDRPEAVRKADKFFQPVYPTAEDEAAMFAAGNHPLDATSKRYRELEAKAIKAKEDRAFAELKSEEERELFVYKKRIRQADREKEFDEAKSAWLESVQPQLNRLAELEQEFKESEGFKASDLAAVRKARTQYSAVGSDLKVAEKMLSTIETQREVKIQAENNKLLGEISSLKDKQAHLQAKLKPVEPEPETGLSAEDKLFREKQAEWNKARDEGNHREADRLRSIYWSERFNRGNV